MEQNQMDDYLSVEEDSGAMPNPQTPAPSRGDPLVEKTDTEPEAEGRSAPRCAICFRADHGSRIYIATPRFPPGVITYCLLLVGDAVLPRAVREVPSRAQAAAWA